ncbi:MAG TPA: 3-oxoadipyl-CoA thiolase [Bryobacteraceae bacterium]|nr:3-oxoadipyl-CoA thiolase [Bryobacteraceae bacterium]
MPNAFICDSIRTPFGRYGGSLSTVRTDDLAAIPLRAILARNPGLDPAAVDDVIYGCANQAGEDNRNVARMAVLLAGLPERVPGITVNRLCGSGLEAAAVAARGIRAGEIEVAIAGGVESMSRAPLALSKPDTAWTRSQKMEDTTLGWRFVNPSMKRLYGVDSMAETAENVAAENGIARADQDAFAWRSQQRASAAMAAGRLAEEIVPVEIPEKCPAAADEHPRPNTSLEALAALRPIVRPGGTVTAGNASGINDGSGALLLASEAAASRHDLTPRARVLATAVAGVAPRVMGLGPVPAVKKVLALTGLSLPQIDIIELNEAFAAQAVAVLRLLGLPDDASHVNADGGAIALGHPLGASGARLLGTVVRQLQRNGGRYGLCTMCIGVGQGIAMVVERV